jgi:hypothetical protein
MPLFHVTTKQWNSGDLILPGAWGDKIRALKPGVNATAKNWEVAMWELVLESVRQHLAPIAPSRLNCVFVCESEQFAIRFRDLYRPGGLVVPVEALNPDETIHRGDFFLISKPPEGLPAYVDYMPTYAVEYWMGTPPPGTAEVLFGGTVRVV